MNEAQMAVTDFHVKHGFAVSEKLGPIVGHDVGVLFESAKTLDDLANRLLAVARGAHAAERRALAVERAQLIVEEVGETLDALLKSDRVLLADALADLAYVVIGTAVAYGIPLAAVFAEVHRSNMTKPRSGEALLKGRESKGQGYEPPRIVEALEGRL